MTGCDTLVPTGKWTACDKIEQLEGMRLLRRGDCCAHSLPVKTYDLYKWTDSNLGLQHLVEVFYAVLCHAALMYLEEQSGRAGGAAADEDDDIDLGIMENYGAYVDTVKNIWYKMVDANQLPPHLVEVIDGAEFTAKHVLDEKPLYEKYLTSYLAARELNTCTDVYRTMKTDHYSTLFDEYFCRRSTGLVNTFGGAGPNDLDRQSFVTMHVKDDWKSCVGFVCMREYLKAPEKNLSIRGIVTCPFYRFSKANERGTLGAANSFIAFLDEYRTGRLVTVDPIMHNHAWSNRLADIPFFRDSTGNRIERTEERRPRSKRQKSA